MKSKTNLFLIFLKRFFMDGAAWGLKKITQTLQNLVTVNYTSV